MYERAKGAVKTHSLKNPECFFKMSRAVRLFCFPSRRNAQVRRRPIKVNKLINPV